MSTLFKLAWRNVWRSKRRTLITAASILFAVLLASFMQSIQKGAWDHMVDNVVGFYYGYAQVHSNGYWDDRSLDKAFELKEEVKNLDQIVDGMEAYVPRIESFALASFENQTRGVLVIGTATDKEDAMTGLSSRLIEGKYLEPNEEGAIVAAGVAEMMKMGVGDTLVLISQGYRGVNAAGKYAVKGIVKFGSPQLNKQMVYLPLAVAQELYGAYDLVTSVALDFNDRDGLPHAVQAMKTKLGEDYEVMDWEEMLPELVESRELDTAGNYLVLFILYLIIAFGIFGTILMMTKEREYEFGILLAIGMHRWQLSIVLWLEILMVGVIGVIGGLLVSIPIVYYFSINPLDMSKLAEGSAEAYEKFGFEPIFPAAFEFSIFANHMLIVFLLTTVMAVYPFLKIKVLSAVQAMRG